MATINIPSKSNARTTLRTHEGAPARRITPEQQLERILMTCMLWEDQFYVDGKSVVDLMSKLVHEVSADVAYNLGVKAHEQNKLRHAPLWIVREMARGSKEHRLRVAELIERVASNRPDQLTELIALYWKDKRQPLSAQLKKGIARTFPKYSAYQLGKYNRDGAVKLRDVLFLGHPKPKDDAQAETWKKLIDGTLESPDTWEVALSGGADKKETFTRLIQERKLGALALLRNLRNMIQAGVDESLIREAIRNVNVERVLPFRFISAAKYAPQFEPELEQAMFKCLEGQEKLSGKTALLIDGSGSMGATVSGKSEITRFEAAAGVGILLREVCETVNVYVFGSNSKLVPARRGFALKDAMHKAADWGGTYTENAKKTADKDGYDRIIILTDEQSHQALSAPKSDKAYVINVAAYQNGVGYGKWHHVDGWSEAVVDYITTLEKQGLNKAE